MVKPQKLSFVCGKRKTLLRDLVSPRASASVLFGCCFSAVTRCSKIRLLGVLIALQAVVVVIIVLSNLSLTLLSSSSSDSNCTEKKPGFVDRQNGSWTKGVLFRPYTINYNSSELNVKLIELQSAKNDTYCVEIFLQQYELFCESTVVPRARWVQLTNHVIAVNMAGQQQQQKKLELCPCIPRHKLTGQFRPFLIANNSESAQVIASKLGISRGGSWFPTECASRQRLAIIIPFRDREAHLQMLLRVIHPMLQRQLVDYTIFVVEQGEPEDIFNKASVMNAGYKEVRNMELASSVGGPFDCYLFHDVDMFPEDDRNFYGCGAHLPRHVGAYVDKYKYRMKYYKVFGGATSFRPEVFELVNGFSNEFYGWGGEDDDMLKRIEAKGFKFVRFPRCVARYSMIKHPVDERNKRNKRAAVGWRKRPAVYRTNGLNSLRYTLVATEKRPLYTWLLVSLPPPPP